MRLATLIVLLVLAVSASIGSIGSCAGCIVDDFEGYTKIQWYLHNGASYKFSNKAVSGEYSIYLDTSYTSTGIRWAETREIKLDKPFRISFYFLPRISWEGDRRVPFTATVYMVEAEVKLCFWKSTYIKDLGNGSRIDYHKFYLNVTASNNTAVKYRVLLHEEKQALLSKNYVGTKNYQPEKWIHVIITYSNHNLTLYIDGNRTVSILVDKDPPSMKLIIKPAPHYFYGMWLDRLEICNGAYYIIYNDKILVYSIPVLLLLLPLILLVSKRLRR